MKSIRVLQSSLVLGALVAVAGFAACEGNIGSGGGGVGTATNPSGTGGTAGQSGAGTTTPGSAGNSASASSAATITADSPDALPPAAGAALTPESSGTLLMRRLVNAEYDNIMSHLLGDTTQPALLFPSDGIVLGNAPNTVADLNVQLYYQTAQTLVATALANPTAAGNQLQLPAGCSDTTAAGAAQTTCATQFITSFGLLAYRRPIATAEQTDLLTVFSTATGLGLSFTDSIGYVAQAMLQSPNFIYHWEIGPTEPTVGTNGLAPLTPWQVASRLSLELWNDMPDQTLLTAAQSGQLSTQAQVSAQATRMYADPKFAQALYDFHLQWLLDPAGNQTDLGQSIHSSPAFTTTVAQSLQTEFTDFLSSVYAPPGDGTLKTLLTATYTYANPALAAIYGVTVPGPGFSQVQLPATQRAGIFTQQAFLESQADTNADNPVRRGLCIYTQLLAGKVGNPPANVPSLPTTVSAGQTTRQTFTTHAASACAQGCHNLFDPAGFAFENYDAIGAYRTTDNGSPVDSTGSFYTPGGTLISFQNAIDLVTQLSTNDEAEWSTTRNWLRYGIGRIETTAEVGSLQIAYRAGTATTGFSIRNMLTSLLTSEAFLYRTPSVGETL
ncbi:MAG: DUF1592 domain-containing protein [Polyangiaceae bacterium]|jgi:hypothetical protein